MAVNLTVEVLAHAMRITPSPTAALTTEQTVTVARLLGASTAMVDNYAEDAPEAVSNEAAIRLAGWMHDQPPGRMNADSLGLSGARSMLGPYRIRRALSLEGTAEELAQTAGINAAEVLALILDWAQAGNDDPIPTAKLVNAPSNSATDATARAAAAANAAALAALNVLTVGQVNDLADARIISSVGANFIASERQDHPGVYVTNAAVNVNANTYAGMPLNAVLISVRNGVSLFYRRLAGGPPYFVLVGGTNTAIPVDWASTGSPLAIPWDVKLAGTLAPWTRLAAAVLDGRGNPVAPPAIPAGALALAQRLPTATDGQLAEWDATNSRWRAIDKPTASSSSGALTARTTFAVTMTWTSSVVITYLSAGQLYYITDTRSKDRLYPLRWNPVASADRMLIPVLPDGSRLEVYPPNFGGFENTLRVRAFDGTGAAVATSVNIYTG